MDMEFMGATVMGGYGLAKFVGAAANEFYYESVERDLEGL